MAFLPLDLLKDGARELNIELTERQLEQFDRFASMLVETNRIHNLTRITEPEEIVRSHYLDSLTCLRAVEIPLNSHVIDVGTGAGLPGVPIAIVRHDIVVTLLDASQKKLNFLEQATKDLGLTNIRLLVGRAEEIGRAYVHREHYDAAFARALADMKILAELCLPLVAVGGHLVAQKSSSAVEEIEAARSMVGQLGGRVENIVPIAIPGTDIERLLVVVEKQKSTPAQFPRPYSRIVHNKSK